MTAAVRWCVAALGAVLLARAAPAQEQPPELTPAGKAIVARIVAAKPPVFPFVVCAFHGGACGAVNRDGTIAVPPRYDWIGMFSEGRAIVGLGGLYGLVDEQGREIVRPQYRSIGDFKFGFAQVDVDGKSGLIDRDGKMVIEPKYGFIEAIAPDRFRVSDRRWAGVAPGITRDIFPIDPKASGTVSAKVSGTVGPRVSLLVFPGDEGGVIDIAGRWIEAPGRKFDKDDPSIRWVQQDKLWGLRRADGTWLIEPRFQQADRLSAGLARVTLNGKVGFIDRTGKFAIEPVLDEARPFVTGFDRTSAKRDGIVGVIDKNGAWVLKTDYQEIVLATISKSQIGETPRVAGWHFKQAGRWGLLALDGHVVLDADFDQYVSICSDGHLVANKNKQWLKFRADGSPLQPPDGHFYGSWCGNSPPHILQIGDKVGLVAADWTPLTPVHFDAIKSAGGADVWNAMISGKWGRIALDGHWLLEPKFDYLSTGLDLFVAAVDGKRGFMRADGSWLIEPKFDAARVRDADTAFVTVAGATGLLRLKDQSWVIPPRPGAMCDIPSGGILSKSDHRRTFFTPAGEVLLDFEADLIGIILNEGVLPFRRDGKWGLVDTAGTMIVEPTYDHLTHLVRGIAWATRGDRQCPIDRRGAPVPGIACEPARVQPNAGTFPCSVEPA